MKKLQRLLPDDPMVRTQCDPLPHREIRLRTTQKSIDAMLDFVYARSNKGVSHNRSKPTIIGLSANQVGLMKRICIVDLAIRRKGQSEVHVMINPHIIWRSKTKVQRMEGCVNLPSIWGFVPRSVKIDVTYFDRWGNFYQMRATGWAATLIQHEVDHLNGFLYIDHLPDPTKALSVSEQEYEEYKKNPKRWGKYCDVSPLVAPLKG